ncbi:hypothetical protein TNCV_2142851 [Trichonephila clavipes]|nr:hypothetical protein TNCV_2142851 [Trichonephila clavipes]
MFDYLQHIIWAKEVKIETFMTSYKPPEVLSKYYPCGMLCHDKEGNVVTYVDIGNLDLKDKIYECLKFVKINIKNGLQQVEAVVDFSPAHPRPVEKACVILPA